MAQPIAEQDNRGAAVAFLGPATLLMLMMLVAPLILLARFSVNRYDPLELMIPAFTPANYLRFAVDPFYREVLAVTLRVAVLSTALCMLFGLPIAWRLARMQKRWKTFAMLLVILPLFIGTTTRTVGWMILFSRNGVLDALVSRLLPGVRVDLMFSETAVIVGIISINLPFVILTVQSVFEGIDMRLDEAAQGLGAAPSRAFWRIIWPLALPGVTIAGVLCFILAMNAYATPVLLGGPRFQMMAPLVYWEFGTNNNWPFAAAMAFVLMATTLGLTGLGSKKVLLLFQKKRFLF